MARKQTLGSAAKAARDKGYRRIARLQKYIDDAYSGQRMRDWAKAQIKEINSAIQGTRQYSKEGKRYKSKSSGYISKQIDRLKAAVEAVPALLKPTSPNSFMVTQRELNMASVNAPSTYTQTEAKLFYRATQFIWQQEGVSEHERNTAILDYVNAERVKAGLDTVSLSQIVDYVLNQNEKAKKIQELQPQIEMSEEERELYAKAGAFDNEDAMQGSPPGVMTAQINFIRDSFENLFTKLKPEDI